jgi:hypothetical protein
MTESKKIKIWAIAIPSVISISGVFLSFSLNATRQDRIGIDLELKKKVDIEQYDKDQTDIKCELKENRTLILEQNKLFLEIKTNLGELNGKMDLVIKKQ